MTSNAYFTDDDAQTQLPEPKIEEIDHVSTHTIDPITRPASIKSDYIIVVVLFVINLLNYIDRFTVAGVLDEIKVYYDIDDTLAGILQTSFVITYMICSPVFGYLGDRFNRKWIVVCGITFWSLITLSSSFIPKHLYIVFVVMRSLVGVGEASYSTVAPTILSDLFSDDQRTKVMAFFYFAVPIGSGSGFIIGYGLSKWFGAWQAALRFTPIIGLFCLVLLVVLVKEPQRGKAEGGTHLASSPWMEDIRQLTKNASFMFITLGFTAVCFVLGSVSWFAVIYMKSAIKAFHRDALYDTTNVAFVFGATTILAGVLGVIIGTEAGRRLRKWFPPADTLVCASGMILSAPFFLVSIVLAKHHYELALFVVFITQTLLCLNWALVTDMTMGVVIPSRRATATAYQMVLSHTFGDAGSPYIIGQIKESINSVLANRVSPLDADYYSMQYALMLDSLIAVLGGAFFVLASFYIVRDKKQVVKLIEESQFHFSTVGCPYQPEDSQVQSGASTPPTSSLQHII